MTRLTSLLGPFLYLVMSAVCLGAADDPTLRDMDTSSTLEPLSSANAQSSTVPSFSNSASIQAGTSDTKASLTFAGYVPQTLLGNYLHYEIGGDAPVSTKGSTDEVDIGTVSGLSAGSSAHASASAMWWPHQSESDMSIMEGICAEAIPKLIPGFNLRPGPPGVGDTEIFWVPNIDGECGPALFKKEMLQRIVDGLNATIKECRNFAIKNEKIEQDIALAGELGKTDPGKGAAMSPRPPTDTEAVTERPRQAQCRALMNHPELVTVLPSGKSVFSPGARVILSKDVDNPATLKNILGRMDGAARALSHVTLLTIGTKVNRQKEAYFNKGDLTTLIKDHNTGYGANVAISQIRGNALYAFGVSYEKTFKSDDPTQICSPVKGSTSLKCDSGTIGAPKSMFSRIVFTEARILIKSGVFAVAPRLEYDFNASKFAAKLPLYFAPDKSRALTGGIAFGYVTQGGGFGASIFVNKAFSFY